MELSEVFYYVLITWLIKKLPELTYKALTCQNVLPSLLNVY